MKILTLNAHSLLEENYEQKFVWFLEHVLREQPDLIALQEANQSVSAPQFDESLLAGRISVPGEKIPVRSDNHAAWLAFALRQAGLPVSWVWLPVKLGYGRFDEGLALLSLRAPIEDVHAVHLSRSRDYANWKTRMALGAKLGGDWFYTVHMGWWNDGDEPFRSQWDALSRSLADVRKRAPVWLIGDFNSPAEIRGEGYDRIRSDGWQDAWLLAGETRGGCTVPGAIDGWRSLGGQGARIDHIWCSRPVSVKRARVAFDGTIEPRVSDHFGVLLETEPTPA